MKVLFIELLICMARFGPILVKKVLNVFAITVLFITISSLDIKDLGKVFFSCVLEKNIIYSFPCFFNIIFEFVQTRFIMQLFGCTYTF